MFVDVDAIRADLIDYFGSASGVFPMAIMDVARIENASDEEIIAIARQVGVDFSKYEVE